jgi:acyl carrier protein
MDGSGEQKEILELVCRLGGVTNIVPDKDFYEAGVSSIVSLSILLELEERFGVSIPDARFANARTVNDLNQLVMDLRERV